MTNNKSTKRALLTSGLAMFVCVAMLIGSTFAWFTDSVTSGRNQIVAGNLDVELYHGDSLTEKVDGATNLFTNADGTAIRWEPGVIAYENFKVENVGSLALKYQLTMNIAGYNTVKDTELSLVDVLKVAILDGTFSGDRTAAQNLEFNWTLSDFVKDGVLLSKESDKYAVVIYWEPGANDNDYNLNNGKESSDGEPLYVNLGVTLAATQTPYEKDSFDEYYDDGAFYADTYAGSTEELQTVIESATSGSVIGLNAGTYTLPETIPDGITIVGSGDDTVIDASATYKLTGSGTTISNMKIDGGGTTDTLYITGDNVTISNSTLTNAGGGTWDCNVDVDTDTDITISGCTITDGFRAIMITDANTAYVEDCYLDGVYPINVNASDSSIKLVVTNTTLNGWTSYGQIASASFDNCNFGKETYYNAYAFLRPYADTTITECEFSSEFTFGAGAVSGKTITFTGCTVNEDVLTVELLKTMFDQSDMDNIQNNTWIVDGVAVTFD